MYSTGVRRNKIKIQRTETKKLVEKHTGRHQDGKRGKNCKYTEDSSIYS
jgi:hypothetical protein